MISAMQRLGFTPTVTIEQRKLAVDLAEVVIKWELQRIKDQLVCACTAGGKKNGCSVTPRTIHLSLLFWSCQPDSDAEGGSSGEGTSGAVKGGLSAEGGTAGQDAKRFRMASGTSSTVS